MEQVRQIFYDIAIEQLEAETKEAIVKTERAFSDLVGNKHADEAKSLGGVNLLG